MAPGLGSHCERASGRPERRQEPRRANWSTLDPARRLRLRRDFRSKQRPLCRLRPGSQRRLARPRGAVCRFADLQRGCQSQQRAAHPRADRFPASGDGAGHRPPLHPRSAGAPPGAGAADRRRPQLQYRAVDPRLRQHDRHRFQPELDARSWRRAAAGSARHPRPLQPVAQFAVVHCAGHSGASHPGGDAARRRADRRPRARGRHLRPASRHADASGRYPTWARASPAC